MIIAESPWSLNEGSALLKWNSFAFNVPYHTTPRLEIQPHCDQQNSNREFCLSLGLLSPDGESWNSSKPLADAYSRGADLVATYAESLAHPFSVRTYWRQLSELDIENGCGFEFLLTSQTDLLDSQPALVLKTQLPGSTKIVSALPSADTLRDAAIEFPAKALQHALLIAELTDGNSYYVEMSHPTNLAETSLHETRDQTEIVRTVFHESLEKGVILQSRFRVFVLPKANFGSIQGLFKKFLDSPPPLTT